MAISRGSMTKELFGNRQKAKKMAGGGIAAPTDMMNQRGRDIAAMAQQGGMKMATNAPSRITPLNPESYSQGTPPMPSMDGPVRRVGGTGGMPPSGMGGMPPRGMGGMPPRGMGGMPPRGMGMVPKGPTPQTMKKGGSVRGCGCAIRGKSGAKVY